MAILKHFLHLREFTLHTASDSHGSQICLYEATLCHVDLARHAYVTTDESIYSFYNCNASGMQRHLAAQPKTFFR